MGKNSQVFEAMSINLHFLFLILLVVKIQYLKYENYKIHIKIHIKEHNTYQGA